MPIDEFFARVDSRTSGELERLHHEGRCLLLLSAILAASSALLIIGLYLAARSGLGKAGRTSQPHLQVETRLANDWPIWSSALTAIVLLSGFTWWHQSRYTARAVQDLGNTLTTVLDTTSSAVRHWMREREGEIEVWAEHSDIRQLAGELLAGSLEPEGLVAVPAQRFLREQFSGLFRKGQIEGFYVLSTEGVVAAADQDSDVGKKATQLLPPNLLSRVLDGPRHTALSLPRRSGDYGKGSEQRAATMHVATLLRDHDEADLGVLVFRIDPAKDFTEILQRGRIGVSGESYAFNHEGQLVSESRFDDDLRIIGLVPDEGRGILNVDIRDPGGNLVEGYRSSVAREQQPLTLMARSAIAGQDGVDLEGYNDYRGVPVIGAWTWDHERALGIATEIDTAEAYESLDQVRLLALSSSGMTALLIVALTGLFVRGRHVIQASLSDLQQAHQELEGTSSVILRYSPDGTVLHFNELGQDLFGFAESEIVGEPLVGTIVPSSQSRERSLEQWIDDLETHPERQHDATENENQRKNGDLVWMAWRNRLIRSPDGSLKEILAVGIDITERKLAEQKLEAITESAADAIVIADSSDTVVGWNRAAETIFGWSAEQMIGGPLQSFIPERYRAAHRAGMDHITRTGEGRNLGRPLELAALHREGHEVSIELSLSTWTVASDRFYTGILRDITDRKRMEAELREAREAAEVANQAKSTFLANMSHELRTPLNGVLGYAQLLRREVSLPADQRRRLDAIESCGNQMLGLINEVLDLSKIEAGRMDVDLAPSDLGQLVRGVSDIIRPRAETDGLDFTVEVAAEVPVGIRTDSPKLRQVLVNLLGNAVKFTEGGSVRLAVSVTAPGRLRFDVEDTGAGIAPERVSEIFDPFKQAEAGKQSGGTGLGLAISRRMVELLGGELTVESELGRGSRFTVSLPYVEVLEEDLGEMIDDSLGDERDFQLAPGQDVSVLVADDNEANREILVGLLAAAGFRTGEAGDGRQALERLREDAYQLVLMDMAMPVLDGIEATRALRADPQLRDTVVFAVTASVLQEDRARVMEAGCDDFVPKPFKASEVFTKIERHLGVRYEEIAATAADDVTEGQPEAPLGPDRAREVAATLRAAGEEGDFDAATRVGEDLRLGGQPGLGERIIRHAEDVDFEALEELASELVASATKQQMEGSSSD